MMSCSFNGVLFYFFSVISLFSFLSIQNIFNLIYCLIFGIAYYRIKAKKEDFFFRSIKVLVSEKAINLLILNLVMSNISVNRNIDIMKAVTNNFFRRLKEDSASISV